MDARRAGHGRDTRRLPQLDEVLVAGRRDRRVVVLRRPRVARRRTAPAGVVHRTTAFGVDLFVPRADIERYVDEGGGPVGLWALEALRIAAGRARLGFETDHRTIPHEIGWLETAVHLDKGCYRGQETVARVHNLGRPPRRLVLLHLDGSDSELPPPGSPVTLDGREVGRVTSSARHYELGPIALAVVKRSTDVAAPLVAGGVAAGQEAVVAA